MSITKGAFMSDESKGLRAPTVANAERMRTRAVNAGRWFGGYLAVVGVVSAAWIVLVETVFDDGLARVAVSVGWAALIILASRWAERHVVYPAGATRHMYVAFAVWFVLYLLIIGPLVRWQFGNSVPAWTLASALMSLPFVVAAAQILRRR